MSIWKRILGISSTKPPAEAGCWRYNTGTVEVDLSRARELARPGGAIRLEGSGLPTRLLVVHGEDGKYYALKNKCTHFGRRLDPLPGQPLIQCCSINKSTYDYTGEKVSGPAGGSVTLLPLEDKGGRLLIKTIKE
jgi:nitrite reductase/ring-hydroxylating ferredoxin subunit